MTLEEISEKLEYLLDRDAIRDVVTSYCRGVDRFDRDVLLAAYHPDAIDDHAGFVGDREGLWDFVTELHGTYHKLTQHYVANHLAEIDGTTAHSETYFIFAALNEQGQPFTLLGGRYVDRLEKREGRWAIVARHVVGEWAAPSVNTEAGMNTPEGGPNRRYLKPYTSEAIKSQAKATRDDHDPSYARPLNIPASRKRRYEEVRAAFEAQGKVGQ